MFTEKHAPTLLSDLLWVLKVLYTQQQIFRWFYYIRGHQDQGLSLIYDVFLRSEFDHERTALSCSVRAPRLSVEAVAFDQLHLFKLSSSEPLV